MGTAERRSWHDVEAVDLHLADPILDRVGGTRLPTLALAEPLEAVIATTTAGRRPVWRPARAPQRREAERCAEPHSHVIRFRHWRRREDTHCGAERVADRPVAGGFARWRPCPAVTCPAVTGTRPLAKRERLGPRGVTAHRAVVSVSATDPTTLPGAQRHGRIGLHGRLPETVEFETMTTPAEARHARRLVGAGPIGSSSRGRTPHNRCDRPIPLQNRPRQAAQPPTQSPGTAWVARPGRWRVCNAEHSRAAAD